MKAWVFSIGIDSPKGFTQQGATEVACVYVLDRCVLNYSYSDDGELNVSTCFIEDRKILERVGRTLKTTKTQRGKDDTYDFIRQDDEVDIEEKFVGRAIEAGIAFREQRNNYNLARIPYDIETRKTNRDEVRTSELESRLKPLKLELDRRKRVFFSRAKRLIEHAAKKTKSGPGGI